MLSLAAANPSIRSGNSVGFQQAASAYRVTTGKPASKAVLVAMAWRSCDACGTCWEGNAGLAGLTELGRTAVTSSLGELVREGWLVIGRYPHGGRGLSTEYVVLPTLRELSTAPCGKCRQNMKNPPPPGRFYSLGDGNRPAGDLLLCQTDRETAIKGPPGGHQHSVTSQQSGTGSPSKSEPTLRAGENLLSATPPAVEIPATSQDALRALGLLATPREPEPRPTEGKAQG